MSLALIVAVARNGVIGVDNRLPWRLPADLQRFKQLTLGHHVVMGRRTWESIGRPLPGRTSVVVTRNRALAVPAGVLVVGSFDEALAACTGDPEPFIIGGAEIYQAALPRADRLHLTVVERDFAGDTFFPELDRSAWRLERSEPHPEAEPPFRFETWIRTRIGLTFGAIRRRGDRPGCLRRDPVRRGRSRQ
jgi:dihydrofolate reductase